ADKPAPKRKGRADNKTHSDDARDFGTRRGNLVYIQTALSPTLADALHQRAQAEDVVLGEILMAAVRTLIDGEDGPPPAKRRRRGATPVRKDIGLLPNEAADIYQAATDAGYLPSAFMRLALENYLNQG